MNYPAILSSLLLSYICTNEKRHWDGTLIECVILLPLLTNMIGWKAHKVRILGKNTTQTERYMEGWQTSRYSCQTGIKLGGPTKWGVTVETEYDNCGGEKREETLRYRGLWKEWKKWTEIIYSSGIQRTWKDTEKSWVKQTMEEISKHSILHTEVYICEVGTQVSSTISVHHLHLHVIIKGPKYASHNYNMKVHIGSSSPFQSFTVAGAVYHSAQNKCAFSGTSIKHWEGGGGGGVMLYWKTTRMEHFLAMFDVYCLPPKMHAYSDGEGRGV